MGTGQICTKTLLPEGTLLHGGSFLHESKKKIKNVNEKKKKKKK